MQKCGEAFADYRIIIYENDSRDGTNRILSRWPVQNPKVIFISEKLSFQDKLFLSPSGACKRTEVIAYARNRVLDIVCKPEFDSFKYVIMGDMDFRTPWDIDEIIQIVNSPVKWDGVFANGLLPDGRLYDMFAHRDRIQPVGPEILAGWWWQHHQWFKIDPSSDWRPVYSSFNGLGIYKRKSLLGCRYHATITNNLEDQMIRWIKQGIEDGNLYALEYAKQAAKIEKYYSPKEIKELPRRVIDNNKMRAIISNRPDRLLWSIDVHSRAISDLCEHIGLHADMAAKGKGRFFIDPKLILYFPDG